MCVLWARHLIIIVASAYGVQKTCAEQEITTVRNQVSRLCFYKPVRHSKLKFIRVLWLKFIDTWGSWRVCQKSRLLHLLPKSIMHSHWQVYLHGHSSHCSFQIPSVWSEDHEHLEEQLVTVIILYEHSP